MTLFWITLYLLLQLALSVWAARKTASETDYLLAGRTLGPVPIGCSVFATWFAVEGIVATSGVVAGEGIGGALLDPIGFGVGILLFAWLVAGPIRKGEHVMLTGYLGSRFGSSTEILSGCVACASTVTFASIQLLALGVLVSAVSGLSLSTALIGSTAVVLSYTLLGGLLGDVVTDVVQGAVLVMGLILATVMVMALGGGLEASLAAIPLAQVTPRAPEPVISGVNTLAVALAASIASPELAGRTLGASSARVARNGALLGGCIYLAVGVMPVLIGLMGPQLSVDLPFGDGYLPGLVAALMPTWMQIVFTGALLSAIFSTIDSSLLIASAIMTETAYRRFRPNASDREGLIAARTFTVIAGLVALAIAASGETIRGLIMYSASIGACLLVPVLLGTRTTFSGRWGAPAAIITGLALLASLDWVFGVAGALVYCVIGALVAYFIAESARWGLSGRRL